MIKNLITTLAIGILSLTSADLTFAAAKPKGVVKIESNGTFKTKDKTLCGLVKKKWVPGRIISKRYFYPLSSEITNLNLSIKKANKAQKKLFTAQLNKLKKVLKSRKTSCSLGPTVAVTPTPTPTPEDPCNVKFCKQISHYEFGYGIAGVDTISISCIKGPQGATVSNQMNGEYIINGTYKLGTYNVAKISMGWGGSTGYTTKNDYEINSAGSGEFQVTFNKVSGGQGNMYVSMSSASRYMFDLVPVNANCDSSAASLMYTNIETARKLENTSTDGSLEVTNSSLYEEIPE